MNPFLSSRSSAPPVLFQVPTSFVNFHEPVSEAFPRRFPGVFPTLTVFPSRFRNGNTSAAHIFKSTRASSVRPCNVTSEDSGQPSSSESILLDDEKTLQQKLQIAIDEENYAEAAKIRDSLRVLQEDSKTYVLAANGKFYDAFRNGDLATMQTLWARGDNVCCVHPGSSGISSYDHVMSSWEYVWVDYDFPLEIELRDVQVHVKGDVGYVTCVELIRTKGSNWGRQFATNVFERIDGKWLISVHHASPVDL